MVPVIIILYSNIQNPTLIGKAMFNPVDPATRFQGCRGLEFRGFSFCPIKPRCLRHFQVGSYRYRSLIERSIYLIEVL